MLDDDPLTRDALVQLLGAHCLDARSVRSAELALALLQEWPVDLLIADGGLPGMTGGELVRRCQGLHRRPKIILLTRSADLPLPSDLDQLGVLGVIQKPFVFDSLAEVLARAFHKHHGVGA